MLQEDMHGGKIYDENSQSDSNMISIFKTVSSFSLEEFLTHCMYMSDGRQGAQGSSFGASI